MRGGGTAGGGKNSKDTPQYVRRVPNFLKKYSHLLGADHSNHDSDGPQVCSGPDGDDPTVFTSTNCEGSPDSAGFVAELEGATVVDDGFDFGSDESKSAKAAVEAKEKGNQAYKEGRHSEAIRCFSQAIAYCPKDPILYSNRSAAYAAARDYSPAVDDARKVLELTPRWAKAYSRLGAALVGLNKLDEAQKVYRKGLDVDRGNPVLLQGLQQVEQKIRQVESEEASGGKHVFQKRKFHNEENNLGSKQEVKTKEPDKRKKPSQLLSFAEDEEGDENS